MFFDEILIPDEFADDEFSVLEKMVLLFITRALE